MPHYILKSGCLYSTKDSGAMDAVLARIHTPLCGPQKHILSPNGTLLSYTEIWQASHAPWQLNAAYNREYVLLSKAGAQLASAQPQYARQEDPQSHGWPLNHTPRVETAQAEIAGSRYLLAMKSGQEYLICGDNQTPFLHIQHRGIAGGWDLQSAQPLDPQLICGLFLFCRYLERENEFITV